jgi:hypothetical protein
MSFLERFSTAIFTSNSDSHDGIDHDVWNFSGGGPAIWNISESSSSGDDTDEDRADFKISGKSEDSEVDNEGKTSITDEEAIQLRTFLDREDESYYSSFIHHLVFDKYLKCEVKPWRYPKTSRFVKC